MQNAKQKTATQPQSTLCYPSNCDCWRRAERRWSPAASGNLQRAKSPSSLYARSDLFSPPNQSYCTTQRPHTENLALAYMNNGDIITTPNSQNPRLDRIYFGEKSTCTILQNNHSSSKIQCSPVTTLGISTTEQKLWSFCWQFPNLGLPRQRGEGGESSAMFTDTEKFIISHVVVMVTTVPLACYHTTPIYTK